MNSIKTSLLALKLCDITRRDECDIIAHKGVGIGLDGDLTKHDEGIMP